MEKFKPIKDVSVTDLFLDEGNFRIGDVESQQQCIYAIMADEKSSSKFIELTKHIAKNGIYNERIIVIKDEEIGGYVVKDGNRRVAALKLLNNPNEAPEDYRALFTSIAKDIQTEVPVKIRCELAASEQIALEDMQLMHLGEQEGIGQVPWGPKEKGNLAVYRGEKPPYPVARAVIEYLATQGVSDLDKMPLTTIERLLSPEIREKIGLVWDGSKISFKANKDAVTEALIQISKDFISKTYKVNHVFTPKKALDYINQLFARGIKDPYLVENIEPKDKKTSANSPNKQQEDGRNSSDDPDVPKNNSTRRETHSKQTWDRKRLIPKHVSLPIPASESKIYNVVCELKSKIDIRDTPIAAGVLFRILIEHSVNFYCEKHAIILNNNAKLHNRIDSVAEDLHKKSLITASQLKTLKSNCATPLISTHAVNAWVHDPNGQPDYRILNTFFDNIVFFIIQCWAK